MTDIDTDALTYDSPFEYSRTHALEDSMVMYNSLFVPWLN